MPGGGQPVTEAFEHVQREDLVGRPALAPGTGEQVEVGAAGSRCPVWVGS